MTIADRLTLAKAGYKKKEIEELLKLEESNEEPNEEPNEDVSEEPNDDVDEEPNDDVNEEPNDDVNEEPNDDVDYKALSEKLRDELTKANEKIKRIQLDNTRKDNTSNETHESVLDKLI